jgi:hypothetical protein
VQLVDPVHPLLDLLGVQAREGHDLAQRSDISL